MSDLIATEPKLLEFPAERRKGLPNEKDVPQTKSCFRNEPGYEEYQQQQSYDTFVLTTVLARGFGKLSAPKEGKWTAVAMAGAVRFALTGNLIDPEAFRIHDGFYHALWQLVYEGFEETKQSVPERLGPALQRLIVPHYGQTSGPYSEGTSRNEVSYFWDSRECCPGSGSFGSISLTLFTEGDALIHFNDDERLFLEEIIRGFHRMQELLVQKIRPHYHW